MLSMNTVYTICVEYENYLSLTKKSNIGDAA